MTPEKIHLLQMGLGTDFAVLIPGAFLVGPMLRRLPRPMQISSCVTFSLVLCCHISVAFDPTHNLSQRTCYFGDALIASSVVFIAITLAFLVSVFKRLDTRTVISSRD